MHRAPDTKCRGTDSSKLALTGKTRTWVLELECAASSTPSKFCLSEHALMHIVGRKHTQRGKRLMTALQIFANLTGVLAKPMLKNHRILKSMTCLSTGAHRLCQRRHGGRPQMQQAARSVQPRPEQLPWRQSWPAQSCLVVR